MSDEVTEPVEEPEPKKVFQVYKQNDKLHLENKGTIETERYSPHAEDLGNAFGEGTYLVYEVTEHNVARKTGDTSYGRWTIVTSTKYFSEKWEETDES